MATDQEQQVITAVLATADVFLRESTRLFRPHGVTAAQYNVLNILAGTAEGLSQRELGDALVVDRSNVTGLVNRMARAGWLERCSQPGDRRVHRVVLTAEGRAVWQKLHAYYAAVVAQVVGGFTAGQRATLLSQLAELQAAAKSWRLPVPEAAAAAAQPAKPQPAKSQTEKKS